MTVTEITPVEVTEEQLSDKLTHYGCCAEAGRLAVCGTDITSMNETTEPANCVVCMDLQKAGRAHWLKFGHTHCPLDFSRICPPPPKEPKP